MWTPITTTSNVKFTTTRRSGYTARVRIALQPECQASSPDQWGAQAFMLRGVETASHCAQVRTVRDDPNREVTRAKRFPRGNSSDSSPAYGLITEGFMLCVRRLQMRIRT